jgi:nucleoside phosphorylase/energy-coupling factor transporter ATP-binding protein EcfA2
LRRPGESLWSADVEGAHWQVDLASVHNDSWGLVVRRDGRVHRDLGWDVGPETFIGDGGLPAEILEQLGENLGQRSQGIRLTRREDREFLQQVVAELTRSEWISGRRLRQRLQIENPARFEEQVARLSPRYLRIEPSKEGDFYSPTLPGLLLVGDEHVGRTIETLIAAIRRRYEIDPDARSYDWSDLQAVGLPAADVKLAWTVASIALLSRGGSMTEGADAPAVSMGMPLDAEHLVMSAPTQRFDDYVIKAAHRPPGKSALGPRVDRPWITAPAHLEQDGEAEDYVSAALTGEALIPPSTVPAPWAYVRPSEPTRKHEPTLAKVDFGIVTLREDELEAILRHIPPYRVATGRRQYNLAKVETRSGGIYEVAIVRSLELRGMSEVSRDLLEELAPTWLLAVGIGATLSRKVHLGDVVISSRIVEVATRDSSGIGYTFTSGAIARDVANVIANLPAMRNQLGAWNAHATLQKFGVERLPKALTGEIVSIDPADIIEFQTVENLRRLLSPFELLDCESGHLHRVASSREIPFVAIRGASSYWPRDEDLDEAYWQMYACQSAAAFTAAFLRLAPIPSRDTKISPWSVRDAQESNVEIAKDRPFHIRKVTLDDVRGFERLEISFDEPMRESGQWVVFLGMNGSGKTSILRAITMALSGDEVVQGLLAGLGSSSPMVRIGAMEARIRIECPAIDLPGVTLGTGALGDRLVGSRTGLVERPFVVAYGCRRGSALGGASRVVNTDSPLSAVETLFEEGAALVHAETWLKERKLAALGDEQGERAFYGAIEATLVGEGGQPGLLPGVTALHVSADRVELEGPATGRIPFGALSDGYLTTAGWILDMIARWSEDAKRRGIALDGDFRSRMTGVAIVDEIDLHIHPRWQRDLIDNARQYFPRMTFIVTTHNPLTILGARPGEIYVLERNEAGRMTAARRDLPPGADAERILTGEWFGLASTLDRETLRMLERHRQFLRDGRSGEPEAQDLEAELARRLGPFADTSIERLAQRAAAQVLEDQSEQLSATDREAALQKITRILHEQIPAKKAQS